MPQPDIVVIGGSAGGLQALSTIVRALPAALPASVLIVVHSSSSGPGVLPQILERVSSLPVAFASDGEALVELKTRMSKRAAGSGLTVVSEGFAEGARATANPARSARSVTPARKRRKIASR